MTKSQEKNDGIKNNIGKKEDKRIYVDLTKEDEEDKELIELLEGKCNLRIYNYIYSVCKSN